MEFCALIALEDVASKNFRATLSKVPQGADMAWKHPVLEFIEILWAIEPEDLPKIWHGRLPLSRSQIAHQRVHPRMEPID
jgi:hypothetical protein